MSEPTDPQYRGLMEGIPAREYHRHPAISKHGLDDIAKCPEWYQYRRTQPHTPTPDQRRGTLIHLAVLEPTRFDTDLAIVPKDMPDRPNARSMNAQKPSQKTLDAIETWRRFEAENVGREMVDEAEYEEIRAIRARVLAHPSAGRLLNLAIGRAELSMFWRHEQLGIEIRSRLDFLHDRVPIIVDIKKTKDASKSEFERDIYKFRYDVQAALYLDGLKAVTGQDGQFVFVAVEDHAPYLVACYVATEKQIAAGRKRYLQDLTTYARCMETGVWPGLGDEVQPIEMPGWAMHQILPDLKFQ